MRNVVTIVGLLVPVVLAGCGKAMKQEQLENVARDWCLTIRASQVIPVYPLTEDLVPGDVFMVNTPLDTQASAYKNDGFLPLDQLVTRLHGLDYRSFYRKAYWTDDYAPPPPDMAHPRPLPDLDGAAGRVMAPRAAFPSYTFEVRSGSGAKIAIPVSGVPIGLGFMQADSASGSITISDAYTYGVDAQTLIRTLDTWASNPAVRMKLAQVALATKDPLYLRLVSRVYLTGGVTISMTNRDQRSAGADVGAAKAVDLPTVTNEATADNYLAATRSLSTVINEGLPGGSIRVAQASSRSITMSEPFDRPLVIGYLGFDVPVLETGDLGPPIATQDRLTQTVNARSPAQVEELTPQQEWFDRRVDILRSLDPAAQMRVIGEVANALGSEAGFSVLTRDAGSAMTFDARRDVLSTFILESQDYVVTNDGGAARLNRLLDRAFATPAPSEIPTMGDYRDKDVTGLRPEQIISLVRLRLRQFPSVQLFRSTPDGGSGRSRLILRTWLVDFEVEGAEPDSG